MARSFTIVRSRAPQTPESVSIPVMAYSDAGPRNDSHALDKTHATKSPEYRKMGQWDLRRTDTSNGQARRKPPPGKGATFDFRVTAPPDEAIPATSRSNRGPNRQHIIGIALGSPERTDFGERLPSPRFDTSIFPRDRAEQTSLPRKPSKWKKIAGLFKAKNALAVPTDNASTKPPADQSHPEKSHKMRKRTNSTEKWPSLDIESNIPPYGGEPPKTNPGNAGPLLNVDIPDTHMERYTVMFGKVVNQSQKPSLLARRSKTLDNLRVPDPRSFPTSKAPAIAVRRATSPAQSNFTCYPTSHPSKAAQILGTEDLSRGPSPIPRAHTLPVDSPAKSEKSKAISHMNNFSSLGSPIEKRPPPPPAKDKPAQPYSAPKLQHPVDRTASRRPAISTGPKYRSPPNNSTLELDGTCIPHQAPEPAPVEISTARTICVSAGKQQMLVPIRPRMDYLEPNERFVDRKTLTPRITDVHYGHRHAVSQELRIESV
ncbi:hypothetical protein NUU61_003514 [Penicillium alfredii]|uniref:Uncharacterized protein n=1 Tax=Penicillium alfredii TaxID=1506179 RepID=A0A9W9FJH6_9EURO|nr:uncharacterized protein NUU61_003514 [Penicillium alfredii]KAJ5101292.1 hypothetical protein NUU61_003514 [Penicillium alfredii]